MIGKDGLRLQCIRYLPRQISKSNEEMPNRNNEVIPEVQLNMVRYILFCVIRVYHRTIIHLCSLYIYKDIIFSSL